MMPFPAPGAFGFPTNDPAQPEDQGFSLEDLIGQQRGLLTGLENQGEDPRIARLMEAIQASQEPVGLNTVEKIGTVGNSIAFLLDRLGKGSPAKAREAFARNKASIQSGPQGRKQAQQQKLQSELFIQNFLKDIGESKDAKLSKLRQGIGRLTETQAREEGATSRSDASIAGADRRSKASIAASKEESPKDKAAREAKERADEVIDRHTDPITGNINYHLMSDTDKRTALAGGEQVPDFNAATTKAEATIRAKWEKTFAPSIQAAVDEGDNAKVAELQERMEGFIQQEFTGLPQGTAGTTTEEEDEDGFLNSDAVQGLMSFFGFGSDDGTTKDSSGAPPRGLFQGPRTAGESADAKRQQDLNKAQLIATMLSLFSKGPEPQPKKKDRSFFGLEY